jgi:hypothetical protein
MILYDLGGHGKKYRVYISINFDIQIGLVCVVQKIVASY